MAQHMQVQSEVPVDIRTGPGKTYRKVGTFANGTVMEMEEKNGSWVKHYQGWSEWSAFVRYTPKSVSTRSKSKRKRKPAAKRSRFTIGQTVHCRDYRNQEWMTGKVTNLHPLRVKAEGSSEGRRWKKVQEWTPSCTTTIRSTTRLSAPSSVASAYSTPATSESGSSMISVDSYNWRTYLKTMPEYKQKAEQYVTLKQCVVQESVDPRSSKLFVVRENTEIQIDCVCAERARVISPCQGWIWMSSPRGLSVQSLDFHPLAYNNHRDFLSEQHHVLRQPSRVTTTAPCEIRRTVNCQSDKLCTLPKGTSLTVKSKYKQRAFVEANINGDDIQGWCWLAGPSGAKVELSAVKPTVVLTCPMVNDDDMQTMRNCLGVYGIQIKNYMWGLDDMTVELEVSSHRDGKIALKQLREVNGKPVKLAWKKSYLAYREQCSSRV